MSPLAVMFPKALIWLAADSESISEVVSKCKLPPASISKSAASSIFEAFILMSSTVKVVSVPYEVTFPWAAVDTVLASSPDVP